MGEIPPPAAIEGWISSRFPEVIDSTAEAVEELAGTYQEREALCDALDRALRERNLIAAYASLLDEMQTWLAYDGPPIVASPPYVVVTSRGPVLRLSVPPRRIVISFDVFVPADNASSYSRKAQGDQMLQVTIR